MFSPYYLGDSRHFNVSVSRTRPARCCPSSWLAHPPHFSSLAHAHPEAHENSTKVVQLIKVEVEIFIPCLFLRLASLCVLRAVSRDLSPLANLAKLQTIDLRCCRKYTDDFSTIFIPPSHPPPLHPLCPLALLPTVSTPPSLPQL